MRLAVRRSVVLRSPTRGILQDVDPLPEPLQVETSAVPPRALPDESVTEMAAPQSTWMDRWGPSIRELVRERELAAISEYGTLSAMESVPERVPLSQRESVPDSAVRHRKCPWRETPAFVSAAERTRLPILQCLNE